MRNTFCEIPCEKNILRNTFWEISFENYILKNTFWQRNICQKYILKNRFWEIHFEEKIDLGKYSLTTKIDFEKTILRNTFWDFLTIFFPIFWQIFNYFGNFWQFWSFFIISTMMKQWLNFLQFRTWIDENLYYLTIKSDSGQHSQFLRCLHFQEQKGCYQFTYGGCQGNANNFISKENCIRKCQPSKN